MNTLVRFLHRSLWLCAGLALSFSLVACKKKGDAGAGTAGTEPPPEQPKEEPPVEIKVNWQVGKKLVVRSELLQEMEVSNPNFPTPMKMDSLMSRDLSVAVLKDREGGGRELEVEILAYKTESKAAGRLTGIFDSKSDPKSDITNRNSAPLRKLIGVKLKYLTDPSGKVDRIEGAPELLTKLVTGAPATVQPGLRLMFSEESLKQLLPAATGLPEKPVKPTETWPFTTTTAIPPFGALSIEVTNTFKGMEDHAGRKCAAIDQTGTITMPARTGPAGATPPTIEEATVTGQTWFDPALGIIVESFGDMSFTFKGPVTTTVKAKAVTKLLQVSDLAGGGAQVIPGADTRMTAPPASASAPTGIAAEGVARPPQAMKLDGAAPARK